MRTAKRRYIQRNGNCKCCGKDLVAKKDEIISVQNYSANNPFFCIPCAQFMGDLANGLEEKLEKLGL